jgi:nitroreductase
VLELTPEQLLTTTRSVRKRLDLARPVDRSVIDDCLRIALQAPTSVNSQTWHFVVVTDQRLRAGLAELYRRAWQDYSDVPLEMDPAGENRHQSSSRYLAQHLERVPVHLIPCIQGRPEGQPASQLAAMYGSIVQASWSFQLAARAHGLGSVFTTYHLDYEREAAELLGIPYDEFTQVALIPVAYTVGTEFRPAARKPLDEIVHRDRW